VPSQVHFFLHQKDFPGKYHTIQRKNAFQILRIINIQQYQQIARTNGEKSMNIITKFFVKANVYLFRISGGRLGSRMGKQSVLLLHTLGRKSGKSFSTTLSYYRDGENYLVVASNWGREVPPDWFLNLLKQPDTTIQVKGKDIQVVARQADGDDYSRLWEWIARYNSQYIEYQKSLTRRIPIVILTPVEKQE
jgi:F420H(2)-dependent quinone reductase